MSVSAEVVDPFVSAAMLTALNTAFAAAGLGQLSVTHGIRTSRYELDLGGALPAMAVERGGFRLLSQASGGEQQIVVPVTCYLAHEAATPALLVTRGQDYCDQLRATVETQLADTFERLTCVRDDPQGVPWSNDPDPPTRLVSVVFDVQGRYQKGTA